MKVILRVDASGQIGTGHLMRCLTLADALKARGALCRFVCRDVTDALATMICARGHELQRLARAPDAASDNGGVGRAEQFAVSEEDDARQTAAAVGAGGCDWLVVDHYGLGSAWERRLRAAAKNILVIDDLANRPHDCDLLLDQNFYLNAESRYGATPFQQLLGPRYALLREEFATQRAVVHPRSGALKRILVSFGGVDAANHTAVAITALRHARLPELQVDVVIGAAHPHREQIAAACRDVGFALHVQATHMAQLMAKADLALAAGGSTTWELCCLGVPAVVITAADNQLQLVHDCALAGVLYAPESAGIGAEELGGHLRSLAGNPLLREAMSRAAMQLVDGRGASRVLRCLGFIAVDIRLAVPADIRNLFEWRNHPVVREASRSSRVLEWPEHERWFAAVLRDPARVLLIGEVAGRAVGVVRFDVVEAAADVSIYTVPGRDRAVRGADVLRAAEHWLTRNQPDVRQLNAEVLGANPASHGLFRGAGYQRVSTMYVKKVS